MRAKIIDDKVATRASSLAVKSASVAVARFGRVTAVGASADPADRSTTNSKLHGLSLVRTVPKPPTRLRANDARRLNTTELAIVRMSNDTLPNR